MRAYIQVDDKGEYTNENCYKASMGFKLLGFEVITFSDIDNIDDMDTVNNDASAVIVGGIGTVHKRLQRLGIDKPQGEDYPQELQPFLNRNVWQSTLKEIINSVRTFLLNLYKTNSLQVELLMNLKI